MPAAILTLSGVVEDEVIELVETKLSAAFDGFDFLRCIEPSTRPRLPYELALALRARGVSYIHAAWRSDGHPLTFIEM